MPNHWPQNIVAVPLMFAVLCLFDGLGYFLGPARWSSTPTLDTLASYPGGIRTYGAVQVIVGLTILGGLGFAIHILWWIALIVLVIWLVGFVVRMGEGGSRGRWYRWL